MTNSWIPPLVNSKDGGRFCHVVSPSGKPEDFRFCVGCLESNLRVKKLSSRVFPGFTYLHLRNYCRWQLRKEIVGDRISKGILTRSPPPSTSCLAGSGRRCSKLKIRRYHKGSRFYFAVFSKYGNASGRYFLISAIRVSGAGWVDRNCGGRCPSCLPILSQNGMASRGS